MDQFVLEANLHHIAEYVQFVGIIAQAKLAEFTHCLNNIVECDERWLIAHIQHRCFNINWMFALQVFQNESFICYTDLTNLTEEKHNTTNYQRYFLPKSTAKLLSRKKSAGWGKNISCLYFLCFSIANFFLCLRQTRSENVSNLFLSSMPCFMIKQWMQ